MKRRNIVLIIGIITILMSMSIFTYVTNYIYTQKEEKEEIKSKEKDLYHSQGYNEIRELIYPVGSIYMSVEDDTVAKVEERFGGEWEKIEGKFLLSASSSYAAGSTGGSADAVVVSHTHTFTGKAATTSSTSKTLTGSLFIPGNPAVNTDNVLDTPSGIITTISTTDVQVIVDKSIHKVVTYNHRRSFSIDATHTHNLTAKGTNSTEGVSGTGKNMPPYLSVYMYKRTA